VSGCGGLGPCVPFCPAPPKDAENCQDSPLITRFPGSVISSCKDQTDDAFEFEQGNGKPRKRMEGEFHQLIYNFPKTASKAQVVRNLNTALRHAGYTFVYDSGDFAAYRKKWIQSKVSGGGGYKQTSVTEIKLTQDVVADAAALSQGLATNGHAVVNGIPFDTGQAAAKPESAPALPEVVKLLKEDPKLKIYVVGHTDNVGGLTANLDLSRKRAAAVIQVLTTQYAIAADRMQPFGAGPYAPVAWNDSEDGRTLNRRVELVQQ
jgi:outer membrane protein OmpA-like peptidoglycan-associated protein